MPRLYILTGPSGVGKTTVAERLVEKLPHLKRVVTCTTRAKREGEIEGRSYHFFTRDQFEQMKDRDELLEWDEHYGALYGSRTKDVEAILAEGYDVLIVLDVNGARSVKRRYKEAVVIFLAAPSLQDLQDRIHARGQMSEAELAKRMDEAQKEMAYAKEAQFVVINKEGQLEETVSRMILDVFQPVK